MLYTILGSYVKRGSAGKGYKVKPIYIWHLPKPPINPIFILFIFSSAAALILFLFSLREAVLLWQLGGPASFIQMLSDTLHTTIYNKCHLKILSRNTLKRRS